MRLLAYHRTFNFLEQNIQNTSHAQTVTSMGRWLHSVGIKCGGENPNTVLGKDFKRKVLLIVEVPKQHSENVHP